jgi:hypothetical protein
VNAELLIAPPCIDVDAWASSIIRQALEDYGDLLPVYGSPEWSIASAATRWASVVACAEVRRRDNTPEAIASQLAHELHLERWLKILEDQHYVAAAAAWKQYYGDERWLTHRRRGCGPEAGQIALAWAWTLDEHADGAPT